MLDAILAQSRNTALIMGLVGTDRSASSEEECSRYYQWNCKNSYRIHGIQYRIQCNVRSS